MSSAKSKRAAKPDNAAPPTEPTQKPEAWTRYAFGLGALALASLVYLGRRPGGEAPVWVYSTGLLSLGLVACVGLAAALAWCAYRRPALQRGRLAGLVTLAGVLWLASFPLAYPSSHELHPSSVSFRLPFEGPWRVHQGGNDRELNIDVLHPSRRFGLRFEAPQPGLALFAPADGTLVAAGPAGWVLRVAEGQFLVLEGIESPKGADSGVGERVLAGAPIGRCGGTILVLSLQDRVPAGSGEGIPLRFSNLLVDGQELTGVSPVRGQTVEPVLATSPRLGEGSR